MKIKLIGETETIIENPSGKHNYFGWSTAARLKNGKIAVACSGYRLAHICPFGKMIMSVSDDEGKTFSSPQIVIDTPLDDRDGGLCPFGKSGLIATSFNNTRDFQRKNADARFKDYILSYLDMITDSEEEKYLGSEYRVSFDNGVTFGDVKISPVTSPHGPTELSDGSVLWVGCDFNNINGVKAYKLIGESFEKVGEIYSEDIAGQFCEPHAIQLKNGRIVCQIRVQSDKLFTLYQSVSDDLGATWSRPKQILSDRGGAPAHLLELKNGLLVSTFGYRTLPFGVKTIISSDGGESWSEPQDIYVNHASHDLGYPSSVELGDGSILTVFYARKSAELPAEIMMQKWKIE